MNGKTISGFKIPKVVFPKVAQASLFPQIRIQMLRASLLSRPVPLNKTRAALE